MIKLFLLPPQWMEKNCVFRFSVVWKDWLFITRGRRGNISQPQQLTTWQLKCRSPTIIPRSIDTSSYTYTHHWDDKWLINSDSSPPPNTVWWDTPMKKKNIWVFELVLLSIVKYDETKISISIEMYCSSSNQHIITNWRYRMAVCSQ